MGIKKDPRFGCIVEDRNLLVFWQCIPLHSSFIGLIQILEFQVPEPDGETLQMVKFWVSMNHCFIGARMFADTQQISRISTETQNFLRYLGCLGYGGFLKWVYPQIIHLSGILHYKPSHWGCPIYGNLHIIFHIPIK